LPIGRFSVSEAEAARTFWIYMNLNDEFSFAGVSSIHRVFELFDPRKSTQLAEFSMETHPNFGWDSFLDWCLGLGSEGFR
jgi:hypothetical protein